MTQGSQFANAQQASLGATPKEGPLAVPFNIDFTAQQQYVFDLTAIQQQAKLSMVQTIYVDNSLSSTPISLVMANSYQRITIPPFSQAYVPVVLTNKIAVTFQSASGLVIPIIALNIAMNATVWSTSGSPSFDPTTGALMVSDPILEAVTNGQFLRAQGFTTYGDGTVEPEFTGSKAASGLILTAAAVTLFTGIPGWILKSLSVRARPNTTIAAAGIVTLSLAESGGGNVIAVGSVFVPTAVPTGLTGSLPVIDLQSVSITSKVTTSNLTLTASAAVLTGGFDWTVTYAQTAFVGG